MRVLLVSQEMPPETGWGGIGTYVDVLSEALARRGHEIHVLSVAESRQPSSDTRPDGVSVHRFPLPPLKDPTRRLPETWMRLRQTAFVARAVSRLDLRPDVVEAPEWMAEGLALGWSRRLALVVRLHSSARQLFRFSGQGVRSRGWDGRWAAGLEELSARRGHLVTSTSSNLSEVMGALRLDPAAVRAIPIPIRLPPPRPLNGDAPPRVTFVGRLERRKAPEVVLRAAPSVLAEVPETRFVFVGRDPWDPEAHSSSAWLRREAERLGVAHAVELTGQLDGAGVMAELERATVCAFPSQWESFGNAVAEASAVGRPVVTTPIAAFQELVQEGVTGRLVPAHDSDAWARALTDLLRDRDLARRMGEAGTARIAQVSRPEVVADMTVAAYRDARERFQRGSRAGRR
jgi:glycosyltransferase involved in cell wall biosynthesis